MKAVVLGISTDTPEANADFKRKNLLPFPLLCDSDRRVSMAYGAAGFEKAYYSNRITYVIDEQGTILNVLTGLGAADHAEEALKAMKG